MTYGKEVHSRHVRGIESDAPKAQHTRGMAGQLHSRALCMACNRSGGYVRDASCRKATTQAWLCTHDGQHTKGQVSTRSQTDRARERKACILSMQTRVDQRWWRPHVDRGCHEDTLATMKGGLIQREPAREGAKTHDRHCDAWNGERVHAAGG